MRVLVGNDWRDGFLDYHRWPQAYRVEVRCCIPILSIEGQFYIRRPSLRMVLNYCGEIGIGQVARKIRSRHAEKIRNDKYVLIGCGTVIEAPENPVFPIGSPVVFVAPSHPRCVERVVLPQDLLAPCAEPLEQNGVLVHAPTDNVSSAFAEIAGWSEVSGAALDQGLRARVLEAARAILGQTDWRSATRLTCGATDVRERDGAARRDDGSLRVVLFGFGNYAKTTAIPNLPRGISLAAVHELDPTQLPVFGRLKAAVDSSPRFRPDERYDVALVAGFHHTHAPLAIEALDCGQWAIIEKPLVTDADQLAAILAAMDRHPGKLFVCFQRRYSALTELARRDLDLGDGEPVSYHCIVHEPLLPARHWYRWPNSKSRIVTNACHWIDHFLYLNGWAEAHRTSVQTASDSTIACFAELVNGACFTMSISYAGSERVGVQDYVELHAKGMTVRIVNQSHYSAESNDRVVRTARINKISTYRSMYRRIGEQILAGGPGDCRQSVVSSCGLMLQLDAELAEIMGPRDVLEQTHADRNLIPIHRGARM